MEPVQPRAIVVACKPQRKAEDKTRLAVMLCFCIENSAHWRQWAEFLIYQAAGAKECPDGLNQELVQVEKRKTEEQALF